MILTSKLLHELSGHPTRDGFTKIQVEMLGFTWPPPKGWLSSWIGREMSQERYDEIRAAYFLKKKKRSCYEQGFLDGLEHASRKSK